MLMMFLIETIRIKERTVVVAKPRSVLIAHSEKKILHQKIDAGVRMKKFGETAWNW